MHGLFVMTRAFKFSSYMLGIDSLMDSHYFPFGEKPRSLVAILTKIH